MSDKWKLIHCEHVEWKQDESGHYCIINYIKKSCLNCMDACGSLFHSLLLNTCPDGYENNIRLDWLTTADQPAVSFEGTADAVRKNAMRYAEEHGWNVSLEHAAYIGAELAKAEILGSNYVQE